MQTHSFAKNQVYPGRKDEMKDMTHNVSDKIDRPYMRIIIFTPYVNMNVQSIKQYMMLTYEQNFVWLNLSQLL